MEQAQQSNGLIPYPTRILCPTDFSPFSRRALAYAIALARPAQAKLSMLHVCALPLPSVGEGVLPEWMPDVPCPSAELMDELRRFAAPARSADLRTELLIRDGDPGDEIVHAARAVGAGLIVMGSHGRRGLQRAFGSHAERVLRAARCPVLTVSGPVDRGQDGVTVRIGRILCAASASPHSSTTIAQAIRIAEVTGAQLTVVHVSDPRHPTRIALPAHANRLAPERVSLEERVTSGASSSEILRRAEDLHTDLIVVGHPHRRSPSLGFPGSTSGRVVRGAACGVLTVMEGRFVDPEHPFAGQRVLATVGPGTESGHGGPW